MRQVFSRRAFKARWRGGDPVITEIIIVACVAIWLLEVVFRYVWPAGYSWLLNNGAFQPMTAPWRPWTFLTAAFLHQPNTLWHILFNMLTLWCIGPFLERMMGHWAYLILYVVSAIGGNVGMLAWAALGGSDGWYSGAYGASGALFGLFAAVLVVYRKVGEDLRSMLIWMGINFLMPVVMPNIAWQAHVAGFIVGGLLTLLVIDGPKRLWKLPVLERTGIYGGAVFAVLVVIALVCLSYDPLVQGVGWPW